jgi:hypothetical protein
MVAVDSRV